jgi:hypothetical protein
MTRRPENREPSPGAGSAKETSGANGVRKNYAGLRAVLGSYFEIYGGWKTICRSPYAHVSLLFTILCTPMWSKPDWWNDVLNILPNLLGFTLGGFAVFLSFGNDAFRKSMAGGGKIGKPSPYMGFSATFVHMILMQVMAMTLSIIAKSRIFSWIGISSWQLHVFTQLLWAIGFAIFVYSLLLSVAATIALFRIARQFDKYHDSPNAKKTEQCNQIEDPKRGAKR